MSSATDASRPLAVALTAFTAFTLALFIAQYYRTAMALLAPLLHEEMALTADRLGLLAATYFMAFGLVQLPVGLLLDRFGPRRTVAALMGVAMAGCILFAGASSYLGLMAAQVLIGVGTAGGFMGGVMICARWFSPRRAAAMTGLMLGAGNLGGIVAATPLAIGLEAWGWRATTLALAAVVAADVGLIFLAVRDAPPGHAARHRAPETALQILAGLGQILRSGQVWRLMALAFVGYASVMAVRGLWGGPYLLEVHRLGPVATGHVLLAMSLGIIAGAIGYGLLEQPFDSRKRVALAGGSANAALFAVLALWPSPPLWLVVAAFVGIGACGQTYVILLSHGRAGFADRLVGRVITTLNMAAFLGTFSIQAMSGVIVRAFQLDDGSVPEIGYRAMFAFVGVVVLVAVLIYAGAPDARPSEDATRARIG
ncbi:MAG: MFS transporter [Alphaproteobacteria bacterium]|nr:MFS transporter [Alphaproteobacteria bacterium]